MRLDVSQKESALGMLFSKLFFIELTCLFYSFSVAVKVCFLKNIYLKK